MLQDDQSTLKAFPLRMDNVRIGVPSPGGLFGDSRPRRFSSERPDALAPVIVVNGKFYCIVDGRRIELRLTREAIAAIRGQ